MSEFTSGVTCPCQKPAQPTLAVRTATNLLGRISATLKSAGKPYRRHLPSSSESYATPCPRHVLPNRTCPREHGSYWKELGRQPSSHRVPLRDVDWAHSRDNSQWFVGPACRTLGRVSRVKRSILLFSSLLWSQKCHKNVTEPRLAHHDFLSP